MMSGSKSDETTLFLRRSFSTMRTSLGIFKSLLC
jgi:hypothetical protein